MLKILTPDQMKNVEKAAFDTYVSETELMKIAGNKCSGIILKNYGDDMEGKTVSVICGKGKNAGDGFVIASDLHTAGIECAIVLIDDEPKLPDPVKYFNIAKNSGIKILRIDKYDFKSDYIIDCIFGIGFHGNMREPYKSIINEINMSNAIKISIDVPSGVNSDNGSADDAVKADFTIAVSDYKFSHVLPPANAYCGKIALAKLGIPNKCYPECHVNTISKSYVKSLFGKRDKNCNKGTNGRLINISGSYLMPGAAVISSKAALKSGVGLLECAFPRSIYNVLTAHLIQPIFTPLCENEMKTVSIGALSLIMERINMANAVLIGCGLQNNDDTQVIVNEIVKNADSPVVIDADGLNAIKVNIDVFKSKKSDIIITPHPGEMARLIDKSVDYVQSNRIKCAVEFAKKYNIIVVLKGANTVVTNGQDVLVNLLGNPGMAMAGTGDMLAGIIASFTAQGIKAFDAAAAGVYIHSLCGDITEREVSTRGMVIEDMLDLLGSLMSEFE